MNKNPAPQIDPRERYMRKIQSARVDIVLMIMLTIINMFLIFTESQTYFIFSAFIPYRILLESAFFTGKMPESFYEGLEGEFEFFDVNIFYSAIAIVAVILAVYLLCFLLSKKKAVWIIVATVLFAADTMYLLSYAVEYNVISECVIDILLHAYVLYCLISGIISSYKLKALPEVPETVLDEAGNAENAEAAAIPQNESDDITAFNSFDNDENKENESSDNK